MTGRRLGVLLAGLCALLGRPARAAPPPGVRLHLGDCVTAPAVVRRLFAIELGVALLPERAPGAATARVLCPDGERALVELRVDDPITGKSLRRSIDLLAAPPRAQPRLLALALAELLFTSWTELALQPPELAPSVPQEVPASPAGPGDLSLAAPAAAPPTPPPVPPAARQAARALVQRRLPALLPAGGLRLTARLSGQAFPQSGALLGGAAVQLGGDHGHHLGWSADGAYHYTQAGNALGTLNADAISAAAALLYQRQLAPRGVRLGLRAGGGLRAGAVRLRGLPAGPSATGASLWAPLAGPTGVLSASLGLPRHLVIDLQIEGGYLLTPARGLVDGVEALALAGPWLGLQLGIGVMP